MEETLNCLRYANRAKNIQNHAVVNVDATSRLVSELRGKMQLLAADLLRAHEGKTDDCTIPIEVVESLANGGDGEEISGSPSEQQPRTSTGTPLPQPKIRPTGSYDNSHVDQELQTVKAQSEVYRVKLQAFEKGDDPSEALQQAFVARAAEYEREIAQLKAKGSPSLGSSQSPSHSLSQPNFDKTISHEDKPYSPNLPPRTPVKNSRIRERSESPDLTRLREQVFGSMSQSNNLDAEVEAEEKAVADLTSKYLGNNADSDSENHENDESHQAVVDESTIESMSVQLEADLFELSNSISAKEELIQKLQVSQEKYEVCMYVIHVAFLLLLMTNF
jgi:hypothetical protein